MDKAKEMKYANAKQVDIQSTREIHGLTVTEPTRFNVVHKHINLDVLTDLAREWRSRKPIPSREDKNGLYDAGMADTYAECAADIETVIDTFWSLLEREDPKDK